MGYKILSDGIYSPSIGIGKIQIEGLYLRLNNKLILTIEKLDLSALQTQDEEPQAEENETAPLSAEDVLGWIKKFLFVISYFEKLDIQNVVFADREIRSVHYDGHEYRINAPEFMAYFDVEESNKDTELLIHELKIPRLDLQVQGKFVYQSLKKTLEMDIAIQPSVQAPSAQAKQPQNQNKSSDTKSGEQAQESAREVAQVEQPTLYVRGITDFYKIDIEASSSHLYSLDVIKPYVEKLKNKTLNDWLFKNIRYDVLKLHSLKFQSTLDSQFFTRLQKTLALDLAIEAPKIYLAPRTKPIEATRIIMYMRDENLSFLLKDPFFTNIKLDGSEIKMSNVFTQPLGIKIMIRSNNATMSDDLNSILQIYGVNVPLRSADSKLRVKLDIDIQNKDKHTQVALNGNINASQTTLRLGETKLNASNLNVNLVHSPTKAYMQIVDTKIDYANSIRGAINLMWNLQDSKFSGDFKIDTFALTSQMLAQASPPLHIPEGSDALTERIIKAIYEETQRGFSEEILKINPQQMPKITISGDIGGQDKVVNVPEFGARIHIRDKDYLFELSDIAKLYPHSPILQYFGIPSGNLKLQSSDFESFTLNGEVNNLEYPLYDKEAKKLRRYFLEGVINSKGIMIHSKNRKFLFVKEGNVTKIIVDGYNLRIDEIFSSKIPVLARLNEESDSSQKLTLAQRQEQEEFIKAKQQYERQHKISPHITYIEARDMEFYLGEYVIPSDVASMSMRDGMIRADITYGNGVANVDMAYSRALLRLSNFSDTFLNRVWGRDIFRGGLFNFKGVYDEGVLKGEITMQNTTYRDLAIVQNVLALIDTIPALLTFRKPGLGAEGYEIKSGKVDFIINNEYLVLENVDVVGSSIDVEGGGLVNLKSKALDIALKASTLKTLASVIDKIPLLNYVILGDDGKFATGVLIKGTLDKPKSEVSVAEDLLFSPFEMVGRILKPVDNLLGGLSEAVDKNAAPPKRQIKPQPKEEFEKAMQNNQVNEPKDKAESESDEVAEPNLPQQEE